MEDLDIEELKRRKMEEMKQKFAGQEATEQHAAFAAQEQEAQLDAIMRKLLEPEAKARLANVRLVNKETKIIVEIMYGMVLERNSFVFFSFRIFFLCLNIKVKK